MINSHSHKIFLLLLVIIIFINSGCTKSKNRNRLEAERLLIQVKSLLDQQKYTDAIPLLENIILLNTEMANDSAVGENYNLLGNCWCQIGQYDSALGDYQKALQYSRLTGNQKLDRNQKFVIAKFYLLMNENSSALAIANDAAATARVFSDSSDLYSGLSLVAEACHKLGKYDQEFRVLVEMTLIDSIIFKSNKKVELMIRQIESFEAAGQHGRACEMFEKTISDGEAISNDAELVQIYCTWGSIQQLSNHPDSALRSFSQALTHINKQTDRVMQVKVLASLGCLAYRSKHFDNARMFFADALNISSQAGNPVLQTLLRSMIVACDWKLSVGKSTALASEFLRRSTDIISTSQQIGYQIGEAFALFLQMRIKEQSNDTSEIISRYQEALQMFEQNSKSLNIGTVEADIINAFMEGEKCDWYDPLLLYYCATGNQSEAFDLIERKNAQDIVEFFTRLNIRTANERVNQSIRKIQQKYNGLKLLEQDIHAQISSGKKENYDRLEALKKLRSERHSELSTIADELGTLNSNFRWLLFQETPKLRQVQDTLQTGTALLEYILLSDAIYCLVVTHDTTYIYKIGYTRSYVLGFVQEFIRLLCDTRLSAETFRWQNSAAVLRINELSVILGKTLIEPILLSLNNISRLYLVPSEEFSWLPFHTLEVDGTPIIDRCSINYLPAAAVLLFSQKKESIVRNIIGIGNPGKTDWDVEYELKDIRSFFDSARMVFEESSLLSYLDTVSYDLLHFAVEFDLDYRVPDNSVMVFADVKKLYGGERITLGEALKIAPPMALVFSNISPIAGGFYRYAPIAFLANGTPTVISTMWQGDRKAKKYFGEMFYTSLKAGLPASQAYHDAIIAMMKKPEFSSLYRWGLFYRFGR